MDPYRILGVAPDATDEQVKAAYRDLARKYHPDNYANNPLADLAQEKMKQINEAYDTIQKQRKQNAQSGGYQSAGSSYQSGAYQYNTGSQSSGQFADIRRLVMQKRIVEAEELLEGVPEYQRNAEWYFLKGNIFYSKGWLDEAYKCFTIAAQQNPSNPEYQSALQQMMWQRGSARPAGMGGAGNVYGGTAGCDCCDVFSTLWCADCCCECMGGDFIRCC